MATVTGLTQYFLEGAIAAFGDKLAPFNAFSYNVNEDGAGLNDVVRVPWVEGNYSGSNAFAYSTGYATANNNIHGMPITLDTMKYSKWDINDSEILQTSPTALTRLGQSIGHRLAADVLADVCAQVTAANYASQSAYSGSSFNTQAVMVNLQQVANELKWPDERNLLVNPSLYGTIVSNTSLVNYAYGSPTVVQDGKLPKYFGFTPYVVTNLPANASEDIVGFACNPDAILVGMAYHAPQSGVAYTAATRITDQATGLVLGYREWPEQAYAKVSRIVDCLFGHAVGNPWALIRIKGTP